MKRFAIAAGLLLTIVPLTLWADGGIVAYLEGRVDLEQGGGIQRPARIGDRLNVGDVVYTAADGLVELELASGSSVTIQADSVFRVDEIADPDTESRKRGFFRVLLGAVSFKFRNMGNEPDVGTPLSVCAVRGTDFTVYAAPDGASMTVVADGLVEVSSGGAAALLAAGQGVEAVVGLGLGEPFEAKEGFIRYDAFAKNAFRRIDEDPVGALQAHGEALIQLIDDGAFYRASWETTFEELEERRAEVRDIQEKQGDDAAAARYKEIVSPLQIRALDLSHTYGYYLISAKYLRRFVLSSYYTRMRTRFLADPDDPAWVEFESAYRRLISIYDERLIPLLPEDNLL